MDLGGTKNQVSRDVDRAISPDDSSRCKEGCGGEIRQQKIAELDQAGLDLKGAIATGRTYIRVTITTKGLVLYRVISFARTDEGCSQGRMAGFQVHMRIGANCSA